MGSVVEENFYIKLGECIFGPEELKHLLEQWLKDPKPKTIRDLARIYLEHRVESKGGYLPYDRRRRYKKKDKIGVRLNGVIQLAQVIDVAQNVSKDDDGFKFDQIDVRLLSQEAQLSGVNTKFFISDYHGVEYAGPAVKKLQVIQDDDEAEIAPKILLAISSDTRVVAFEDYWLPSELLVADVLSRLTDIRTAIAECKCALSTDDILKKVQMDESSELLVDHVRFSQRCFKWIERINLDARP